VVAQACMEALITILLPAVFSRCCFRCAIDIFFEPAADAVAAQQQGGERAERGMLTLSFARERARRCAEQCTAIDAQREQRR